MIRVLSTILIASFSLAAPLPKDKKPIYFPNKVGDKCVFEITVGDSVSELTTIVTKVEEKDGGWAVTMESGGKTTTRYEVNDKGILMVYGEGREFSPAAPILKLPASDAMSWEYEVTPKNEKAIKTKFKVSKEEEVKVTAGTFNAIRVDLTRISDGKKYAGSMWFAPNVGVIKVVTESDKVVRTQVLKSFTPGK